MSFKVYKYALVVRPSDEDIKLINDNLFYNFVYLNNLIRIQKDERACWRDSNPEWVKIEEEILLLKEKRDAIMSNFNKRKSHLGFIKKLIAEGKRSTPVTELEKLLARKTKEEEEKLSFLKKEIARLNEGKKGHRPEKGDVELIRTIADSRIKCMEIKDKVYSANKDCMYEIYNQFRAKPQSKLKFRKFDGTGSLNVRLNKNGRTLTEDLFNGKCSLIKIDLIPPRVTKKAPNGIKCKEGTLKFRVNSTESGRPIFVTFGGLKYHRDLPPEAVIKTARVRVFKKGLLTKYELQITVEAGLGFNSTRKMTGTKAGLDLGWRKMAEGIRIGYVYDTNSESKEIVLPSIISDKLKHTEDLQSTIDQLFNENKEYLSVWVNNNFHLQPDWFRKETQYIDQWRSGKRLFNLFNKWKENRFNNDDSIYSVMELWYHKYKHYYMWLVCEKQKTILRREHYYRSIAIDLCKKYDSIYIENLKGNSMAKSGAGGEGRFKSSPFAFLKILKEVALNGGVELIKVPAPYTSKVHYQCGQVCDIKGDLVYRCEHCNEEFDRDLNASRNILRAGLEGGGESARD